MRGDLPFACRQLFHAYLSSRPHRLIRCEANLPLIQFIQSHAICHGSCLSPGDPGCDKHSECICAPVLGSIFGSVILGKLSVIKLC